MGCNRNGGQMPENYCLHSSYSYLGAHGCLFSIERRTSGSGELSLSIFLRETRVWTRYKQVHCSHPRQGMESNLGMTWCCRAGHSQDFSSFPADLSQPLIPGVSEVPSLMLQFFVIELIGTTPAGVFKTLCRLIREVADGKDHREHAECQNLLFWASKDNWKSNQTWPCALKEIQDFAPAPSCFLVEYHVLARR